LVQQLKAHAAIFGHTGRGQLQAGIAQLVGLDQQHATVGLDLVGDIALLKDLRHFGGTVIIDVVEQWPVAWLHHPERNTQHHGDGGSHADDQGQLTQDGEAVEAQDQIAARYLRLLFTLHAGRGWEFRSVLYFRRYACHNLVPILYLNSALHTEKLRTTHTRLACSRETSLTA